MITKRNGTVEVIKKQTDFLPGRKLVPSSPQYLEISGTEISLQSPCQCM